MVTDARVKKLRRWLQRSGSLQKAALKVELDRKTARKYREGPMASERRPQHWWRTRPDPLVEVWPELATELSRAPGLQANTLLALLQQRYPGQYADALLRTLQRRVKQWRALYGPAKEVFFAQVHEPGRLGASDFTHMNDLGVTIAGQAFAHLLYHFVLTHSNWEHVTVCVSESFASLSAGLQNALWTLDGAPARHRTDRMTLAVHPDGNLEEFTAKYRALMAHYGLEAEATNPYSGHENGDVESSHRHFKVALDQALLVRGSRDFASREEYERFVRGVVAPRNAARQAKFLGERSQLRPLPARRLESEERLRVRVGRGTTIRVKSNAYSVPARLVGERVEARVGAETISVWYADQEVLTLPRLRGQDKHHIDYRHVIDTLVRKPGAFARYRYQADLFPTVCFRQAYDRLVSEQPERASQEYLRILQLAARGSEAAVEAALTQLLAEAKPLGALAVERLLGSDNVMSLTAAVAVAAVDLGQYDELLEHKEVCHGECGSEGADGGTGPVFAGPASADDARGARSGGPASDGPIVELRQLLVGAGPARMSAAADAPDRAPAQDVEAPFGEELAGAGPQASADQGGAAIADPVERGLCGPPRERVGVRGAGFGQDALPVRLGPGAGPAGPARLIHDLQSLGAGSAAGQARPDLESGAPTPGPIRGPLDRRPGLCAAEPRGDGSAVHALGRALRARQCPGDEQPAVLEVGTDFQGSDDDGGGDRSAGASLRDRGAERAELPSGGGQESPAESGVSLAAAGERGGPPWGAGSAALACAPVAVAARPRPSLRLAPLRQPPTAEDFVSPRWGFLIVAKGER